MHRHAMVVGMVLAASQSVLAEDPFGTTDPNEVPPSVNVEFQPFPFPPSPSQPTAVVVDEPNELSSTATDASCVEAEVLNELRTLKMRLEMTEQKLKTIQNQRATEKKNAEQAAKKKKEQAEKEAEEKEEKEEQEEEDAKTLDKLSNEWKEFKEETKEKKEAAKKKPTFNIGGRIHWDTTWFPETSEGIDRFENPMTGIDPEDRLFFRRIRLEMKGDVLENMLWRIQLDFNTPEAAEYKDVYIGFKNLPGNHTVLVGNQKRPLGLDHLNSSRFNVFMERPLNVEAFNEDARRVGVAAYAHTDDDMYNFRYGIYTLENTTRDGKYLGDSLQLSGNARLASTPWFEDDGRNYYHWAVSGMVARPDGDVDPNDTNMNEGRFRTRAEIRSNNRWIDTGRVPGAEWYEIVGLESVLNLGPLQITSEFQNTWMQRDNSTLGTGPDLNFHGGYVYVHYMLTGEHIPFNRRTGCIDRLKPFNNFFITGRSCCDCCDWRSAWGAWGIGARLSYLDLSDQDVFGGVEKNATLGLNWWWTAYSKLQVNVIYGDIEQHAPVAGFNAGDFYGISTRMQVDF